jgi:hypothetical protein
MEIELPRSNELTLASIVAFQCDIREMVREFSEELALSIVPAKDVEREMAYGLLKSDLVPFLKDESGTIGAIIEIKKSKVQEGIYFCAVSLSRTLEEGGTASIELSAVASSDTAKLGQLAGMLSDSLYW